MGEHSKIEWTDATWNPIRGCSRVSEGCRNCYAEGISARFSKPGQAYEGLAKMTKEGPRWTGRLRPVIDNWEEPMHWRKPRMIFVNSMSDLFHEDVDLKWLYQLFGVMAACPQHTFQILTKRPERMLKFTQDVEERCPEDGDPWLISWPSRTGKPRSAKWPLPNVWLGVSAEDQGTADERIPILLRTPGAVRWISYEPALGPLDLFGDAVDELGANVDWVVCGAESGPRWRAMDLGWARDVLQQCRNVEIPFFMKQICKNGRPIPFEEFPTDLQVREYPR
jgi:protein gp37